MTQTTLQTRMSGRRRQLRRPYGSVLMYTTVGMVAFAGFVSLGVDVAHVRMVKIELQNAADASARYAAAGMQTSLQAAQNNAVAAAADNTADGATVVVDPNQDVDFGTWDAGTRTFTVLSRAARSSANAVRVTCRHTSDRGNSVSLAFGPVVGKGACDVTAQSIALCGTQPLAGIIGFGGITFQNNTFIGSFNSNSNKNPNQGNANSKARVGFNAALNGGNNNRIQGDAVLGPGATLSGVTVTGSQLQQTTALPPPTQPPWSPQANPGGIPSAYVVGADTTLPGGKYWFTSLSVAGNLTFSGAAVVYLNGPVVLNGSIVPGSGVPADLTIYQYGSNTFGDSSANNMSVTANIVAPNSDFAAKNNLNFYGSAIFNSITVKNNASFFYDEAMGPMNGGTSIATVQ